MIDSQAQLSSGMTGLFGGAKEFGNAQQSEAAAPGSAAKIELHAPGELKGGEENAFQATLTDAAGKPVSDAQVTVTLLMPAMPAHEHARK